MTFNSMTFTVVKSQGVWVFEVMRNIPWATPTHLNVWKLAQVQVSAGPGQIALNLMIKCPSRLICFFFIHSNFLSTFENTTMFVEILYGEQIAHKSDIITLNSSMDQEPRVFRPREVLLGIFGRGVPPGSPNPDPISDQNIPFSTPIFRPGL